MDKNSKKKAHVVACCIQKGGCGKTQTSVNLAVGLAKQGKKVLLIDTDPQSSATVSLGWQRSDLLEETLAGALKKIIDHEGFSKEYGILHHAEGIDVMPCNLRLAKLELNLIYVVHREYIFKKYVDMYREDYDYIIVDCPPSLGMWAVNIYTAVDSVVIPVEMSYLALSGLELLLETLSEVKEDLNPELKIDGILMTFYMARTINTQQVSEALIQGYGNNIKIFDARISEGTKARETAITGQSIYKYSPRCKISKEYERFTKEVLELWER